jgi:DNA-binding HxlR family transcriptional regulator
MLPNSIAGINAKTLSLKLKAMEKDALIKQRL